MCCLCLPRAEMREDLKGRNLTFTEIAKLVGENWQNLTQPEKERFEAQAQAAKDRYHQELAAYKKTAEHRRYSQYLEEFRAKYASQPTGMLPLLKLIGRSLLTRPPPSRQGRVQARQAVGCG